MKKRYNVVCTSDVTNDTLYAVFKRLAAVKTSGMRKGLIGTKDEILAWAAKQNEKSGGFTVPDDKKAHFSDHIIQGKYHCLEITRSEKRSEKAVLFVFGGGMILDSGQASIGLSRKISKLTGADVWLPFYPLCHKHDIVENAEMVCECYRKMLEYYRPENIVFLGYSSGAALILDVITYINELNDNGTGIPMPGLLIPVSPGSVPINEKERERMRKLDRKDVMLPASYMDVAAEIMRCRHDIPQKYIATAHGDFRNAPMTHFYYGSSEVLYAFAPIYAETFRKAGADCVIHVGKGLHHCFAVPYYIPGCRKPFNEIIGLIRSDGKNSVL